MKSEKQTINRVVLVIKEDSGEVCGRATIEGDYIYLLQTYGGSREGTLDAPVKCSRAVLAEMLKLAEEGS